MELEDFDAKTLQTLKKVLLQEIKLEDGAVSWLSEGELAACLAKLTPSN